MSLPHAANCDRLRPLIVLLAIAAGACAENPEEQRVLEAKDDVVSAFAAGDWEAVWSLSAPEAREEVIALRARIDRALEAIEEVYPEDARAEARGAVGADLVRGLAEDPDEAGPVLLGRLFTAETIDDSEGARDGLHAGGATLDGDLATVHTTAGETYTFARTDEGWRSLLVRDLLADRRAVTLRMENAQAVLDSAEAHREAWRTARDPKSPQGAYNLARAALDREPPDAAALHALITDEARAVLVEALEVAREAQRIIQRKTKKKDRGEAYEEHGIALFVQAGSDLELLTAWTKSEGFVPPFDADGAPRSISGEPDSGEAAVVTASGDRIAVRRDTEGYWRLTGYAETLRSALLEPARRALSGLNGQDAE